MGSFLRERVSFAAGNRVSPLRRRLLFLTQGKEAKVRSEKGDLRRCKERTARTRRGSMCPVRMAAFCKSVSRGRRRAGLGAWSLGATCGLSRHRSRRRAAARFYCAAWGQEKNEIGAVPPSRRNSTEYFASISHLRGDFQKGRAPFGRSGRVVPEGNPFGRVSLRARLCLLSPRSESKSLPQERNLLCLCLLSALWVFLMKGKQSPQQRRNPAPSDEAHPLPQTMAKNFIPDPRQMQTNPTCKTAGYRL